MYALPNSYPDDYLDEYIASLHKQFAKQDPVEEMQRIASLTNANKACNKDTMVCIWQEQASLLEYQKHYTVIDYFDQLAERYTFGRRCYRSWMYIFNWLFNAAVVNGYILHGLSPTVRKKKKYAQIDFRHELALGLINNYSSRHIRPQCKPAYIGPDAPQTMVNHVNTWHECFSCTYVPRSQKI